MKRLLKRIFLMSLGTIFMAFSVQAKSLLQNPASVRYLDVELPFRCSTSSTDEGEGLVSTIALSQFDFAVRLPGQTALLPRYQVNGFTFRNKTADVAIAELLKTADIKVVSEEGKYPLLSARDLKGELSSVLEELAHQANLFYTYQADDRTLLLTHKAQAIVQVPHDRAVMAAVLDALNGGHFDPISADWTRFQISLRVTRSEMNQIQNLLSDLIKEKYLLAVQVKLYSVSSAYSQGNWQTVLNRLGARHLAGSRSALVGQALTLGPKVSEEKFLSVARNYFIPSLIASGKVVVPSGWRTHFNFNQCAPQMPYPDLSLYLRTSIKRKNEAQSVLTLDSATGEIASFDIDNSLDQKVVIVGIPVPNRPNQELMMTLDFQFIQLLKKGEQND